MKAAVIHEYGAAPVVEEFEEPGAGGAGAVRLEVLAAGMNPVDLSIMSGTFYAGSPPVPSVAGREGVGRRADGRMAYFIGSVAPFGSFAEQTLVQDDALIDVPEGVDPALATAFGISGMAAWLALEYRGKVTATDTVLVLGATGVVGQLALQAARLLGARAVIAAGRNQAALDKIKQRYDLDSVVRLDGEVGAMADAIRDASGGGVDLTIDPLWGAPAAAAIAATNAWGRLVQIGQSASADIPLPSSAIRGRNVDIRGHTNFLVPKDVRASAYARMCAHGRDGELTIDVERHPLDDAPQVWRQQREGSSHRKLVIVP
jgi:NADPH2:quinone reductase